MRAFIIVMAALKERGEMEADEMRMMMCRLRQAQVSIRNEIRAEKDLRVEQTLITQYFSK